MKFAASPTRSRLRSLTFVIAGTVIAALLGLAPIVESADASETPPAAPIARGAQNDDYFVGANYFSGWRSGDNFHFDYLNGTDWRADHPELEPKYGWYDDTQSVIDQQIVDASANGLDYFVFDWYPERPTINDGGELGGLHTGMNLFRTSAEKSRMQFMINYIDGGSFNIGALRTPGMTQAQYETVRSAEWNTITDKWVSLFADPSYVKIDGKPVIEIYDVQRFTTDFSTGTRPILNPHQLAQVPEERAVLQSAVDVLKSKARAAGFPDVIIGGGLQQPGFSGEYVSAHDYDGLYDFFTAYAWHDMKRVPAADNSYDNLIRDNHDYVWNYFARYIDANSDYVPVVSQGWDNIVHPEYNSWTIDKTPEAFGNYLRETKTFLDEHPQTNLSPGSSVKMAIIGSWNELFEGHYFLPTKADGDAYTSQVGRVFGTNDRDGTVRARSVNLCDELHSAIATASAAPTLTSGEAAALGSATSHTDALCESLSTSDAAAIRAALPGSSGLSSQFEEIRAELVSGGTSPMLLAQVAAAWASLAETAFGITVTAGSSDYSVTAGETVQVTADVEVDPAGPAPVVSAVNWQLQYPTTWPAATVALAGEHASTAVTVPSAVGDGVIYSVSDMFAGPSPMKGNRQAVELGYTLTVGGITVSSRVPLPLTVIPDFASRIVRNGFDGTTDSQSFWVHNQSHAPVSGTLTLETVAGVTASHSSVALTLAPDERRETAVTFVNSTGADALVGATFTSPLGTVDLGTATVSPKEVTVGTTAARDGTMRSDGTAEINNSNGRLQVGNAARSDGTHTEYRPVVSFTLADLGADPLSRVVLDLTEFEAGAPTDIVIEHLPSTAVLSASNFGSAATDAKPFPISGAPSSTGTHRQIDVTSWVLADKAAGVTHSTFRIRLSVVAPSTTSYRTFRPTEFTPSDTTDAPVLKVVYAPHA
ncbi:glycoside hydrolase family 99-like domain-containing protein [Subtercola vilae]|uniref:Uncharacterized protein n=1 Tax=Subtercola vilae TaxID=2056433 RepID=A0A4T2BZQ6_9MICO|nr:glycoside hydrolase family 99-like domain-containing protein [Subtercola vilae]TIH36642.1 hypothetical protein D4765_09765 [Subtercola vilae]